MELTVSDKGNFKVIDVQGKIDRLKDSITLKSFIITLIEEGAKKIALNLSEVNYLDSGALNVLIYSNNALKKSEGELGLIEPNDYVMDVLEVVGLTELIKIYPTQSDFESHLAKA